MSQNILDHHLPLGRRHVRQHCHADHVADRVDARHVGFQSIVDGNFSPSAESDAHLLQADPSGIQATPDRYQQFLGHDRGPVFQRSLDRPVLALQLLDGGVRMHRHSPLLELAVHEGRDLLILKREDAGH